MGKWTGLVAVSLLLAASCSGSNGSGNLGEQVGEAVSDNQLMKEAQAAANQIIRNATDCEAVKSNIEEVNRKLDEVEAELQTGTGRTALQSMRKQVKNVAEACGAL